MRAPTPMLAPSTCSSSAKWGQYSPRTSSGSSGHGLLSIGEEPEKGNQLTLEAHSLLAESGLRFEGNVEGRTILEGAVDVTVCDGFTGNVALKTLEGTIRSVLGGLREAIVASPRGRVGGLLIMPATRRLRDRLDPEATGGGYLLGLRGLVVIAHGSSSRRAIVSAVQLAARGLEHDIVGHLRKALPDGVVESARSPNLSEPTRG